jgi:hypothetical protein
MDVALLQTFIRYLLLALFGYLATTGWYDKSLIEPLVGAGLALFAIVWFMITRKNLSPDKGKKEKNNVGNNT